MNYKDKLSFGPNCIGQVVRIIDKTELIVNAGEEDLTVGDKIIVYAIGDEIKDLNGNSLGMYEYDKEILNVVTTTEQYSICKTNITHKSSFEILNQFQISTYEEMNVEPNDIKGLQIKNKDVVKIGDPIKKG